MDIFCETIINVPSKIIISGEHSCVYFNNPLLVSTIPLFLKLKFSFLKRKHEKNNLHYKSSKFSEIKLKTENLKEEKFKKNIFIKFFLQIINFFELKKLIDNFEFNFEYINSVPEKMGLGSSASFIVSLYKAIDYFSKKIKNKKKINEQEKFLFLKNLECYFHGNSSGLDILSIENPGLNLFTKKENIWKYEKIIIKEEFYILLIESKKEKSTKESVTLVKNYFKEKPEKKDIMNKIGNITYKLKDLFKKNKINKELFYLIKQNHFYLKELNLSCESLENIIKELEILGLEGKLTGGGLGGCIICIVNKKDFLEKENDIVKQFDKKFKIHFFKIQCDK